MKGSCFIGSWQHRSRQTGIGHWIVAGEAAACRCILGAANGRGNLLLIGRGRLRGLEHGPKTGDCLKFYSNRRNCYRRSGSCQNASVLAPELSRLSHCHCLLLADTPRPSWSTEWTPEMRAAAGVADYRLSRRSAPTPRGAPGLLTGSHALKSRYKGLAGWRVCRACRYPWRATLCRRGSSLRCVLFVGVSIVYI